MTKIEFYFDPCCPFCWITSRWLLQVAAHREIDITWRQFSLALKNDELAPNSDEAEHASIHRDAHRVQRVIRQAAQQHSASLIDLYSEFGIRYHIMEQGLNNTTIADVLQKLQLPAELLAAADDDTLDTELQAELESAVDVAGNDIGVPTIVFTNKKGERMGYFGPVLNELPELEESLAIWDGLEKLATVSSFYELKRARSDGPNVFSAAKC